MYAKVFKSNPYRDSAGRFASADGAKSVTMFRGQGWGSSDGRNLMWVTPDKDTAQTYANSRQGGEVVEVQVSVDKVFEAGHDGREITPSKFAVEVLSKAKAAGHVDDKEALRLRAEFVKGQESVAVPIHSLWSSESGRERVAALLKGAGFDAIHLEEDGKDTYGVVKKSAGYGHLFQSV